MTNIKGDKSQDKAEPKKSSSKESAGNFKEKPERTIEGGRKGSDQTHSGGRKSQG